MYFITWLKNNGIPPEIYLEIARARADIEGYDPYLLNFSNDEKHKLMYDGVKFGATGYNDYILYYMFYNEDIADIKRKNYRKRATNVMKQTNNPLSPASLSLKILW